MAMPLAALGDHPPRCHVQGGKQCGGAPEAFHTPQGEFRLGAVQRLDLGLLVHAQHQGHDRARSIPDFLDKEGIVGQLEGLRPDTERQWTVLLERPRPLPPDAGSSGSRFVKAYARGNLAAAQGRRKTAAMVVERAATI